MSGQSRMGYGDPKAMKQQAAGLFATHLQRNNRFSHLWGKMPKGNEGALNTIKRQTSQHLPFVRCMDLGKATGDEIIFELLNPFGALPIMGSEMAEGRGTGLGSEQDRLRVNQARIPVTQPDTMTSIRSPVDFRAFTRPFAQQAMDRYIDQSMIVHAAGARGSMNNLQWSVPLENHPKFNEIMVNPIKAPTKNRHFVAAGGYADSFAESGGEMVIQSTDILSMGVIDSLRAVVDDMVLPPPQVKFEGDEAADDEPLRVMLVSNLQYNQLAANKDFRSIQLAAHTRASQAKQHPVFRGDVGIWNGFLIIRNQWAIRFFAGDTIKYCADHTGTESSVKIPAALAGSFAVDRAIILGGQAVGEALAKSDHTGIPFFWKEVVTDFDDKAEVMLGTIRGASKFRFNVDTGDGREATDYGVCVLDTVVPLQKR